MVSIELKVINCFIIWHILYVIFTFKVSFYHNVFFGLVWYVTSREVNIAFWGLINPSSNLFQSQWSFYYMIIHGSKSGFAGNSAQKSPIWRFVFYCFVGSLSHGHLFHISVVSMYIVDIRPKWFLPLPFDIFILFLVYSFFLNKLYEER